MTFPARILIWRGLACRCSLGGHVEPSDHSPECPWRQLADGERAAAEAEVQAL